MVSHHRNRNSKTPILPRALAWYMVLCMVLLLDIWVPSYLSSVPGQEMSPLPPPPPRHWRWLPSLLHTYLVIASISSLDDKINMVRSFYYVYPVSDKSLLNDETTEGERRWRRQFRRQQRTKMFLMVTLLHIDPRSLFKGKGQFSTSLNVTYHL